MIIKSKKIFYRDWIYSWLIEKKDYIKESTYANYSNNVFNHIIPKLGNYTLNEINHKIIQDFLLELSKNGRKDSKGGLSEKTIKDIAIILKGSIKKGINENKIKHIELSFNYPKDNKEKNIYILTKHEQNKITDYVLNNCTSRNIGFLYHCIQELELENYVHCNGKILILKIINYLYQKQFKEFM